MLELCNCSFCSLDSSLASCLTWPCCSGVRLLYSSIACACRFGGIIVLRSASNASLKNDWHLTSNFSFYAMALVTLPSRALLLLLPAGGCNSKACRHTLCINTIINAKNYCNIRKIFYLYNSHVMVLEIQINSQKQFELQNFD